MATAVVEERQLVKSLRWWDGLAIAMCNPGFLFGSLGFTMGVFGVLGAGDHVGRLGDHRLDPDLDLRRAGVDVPEHVGRDFALRQRGLA